MYNNYDWGGYLIWRLAPERKVFIDGRGFDDVFLWQAMKIRVAHVIKGTGEREWRSLLQKYGVTYIITTSQAPQGRVDDLVRALLSDAEWVPVYFHKASHSLIFVNNTPEYAQVISKYAINREALFRALL